MTNGASHHFSVRNSDSGRRFAVSRRHPSELWIDMPFEQSRGRREGRGRLAPWSACNKKHAAEPQVQPGTPGLPRAAVLTLIRDLLGVPGLLATVVSKLITCRLSASVGAP